MPVYALRRRSFLHIRPADLIVNQQEEKPAVLATATARDAVGPLGRPTFAGSGFREVCRLQVQLAMASDAKLLCSVRILIYPSC